VGIKLHNKLLEKRKDYTYLMILKRQLKSILLQNAFYTAEGYLKAALQ